MTQHRPRARPKEQPKPLIQLDPARQEEIASIVVIILAILTALGAFNLSGGALLGPWVQFLRALLGWGVYFAPIVLLGLGVWLFLDALDRIVNIGWERPIGLGLMFLLLLAVLHWVSALDNPERLPGAFQGGGIVGWVITSLLVGAFGEIGALIALLAATGITLIMLFNISLPELARRAAYVTRIISNLPREIRLGGIKRAKPPPSAPSMDRWRAPASPYSPQPPLPSPLAPPLTTGQGDREGGWGGGGEVPHGPVAARIIGGSDRPTAPVIQREWRLPNTVEILEESVEGEINQQEIRARVRIIEETLAHFGVPAKVLEVNQGPTITQFGVEPGFVEQKGVDGKVHRVKVKVSRISALQHDLELALAAAPIRIEAPVPGRSVVGIEVPNSQIALVSLRGVMESDVFKNMKSKLRIALGQDVAGQPVCANLATMPHLLIAGATGSGKSVCINTIIACMLCTLTPAEVRFLLIDPKRVELVNLNGIPHLVRPVVVEVDDAVAALQQVVKEMDERFRLFAQKGARNIDIYNHMVEEKPEARLPYHIVIVDELADLMMVAAEQVEHAITRLAQMARATGIHLILATQRPSVDVVTGLIKANFPARISFAVTSQIDSRVVLDTPGAEKLLGRGDMLYMASDSSKLVRLQGCFVSDRELDKLVAYWKEFAPPAQTSEVSSAYQQVTLWGDVAPMPKPASGEDDLLPQAIEILKQSNKASVSLLQRKLRIGYSRAARLIELLEEKGIVGPDEGPTKGRAVRVQPHPLPPASSLEEQGHALSRSPERSKGTVEKSESPRRAFKDAEDDFADWTEEDWEDLDKDT
jgi:S-DNA-T family DNA segregation ATPase FtsK/SpoIIIE